MKFTLDKQEAFDRDGVVELGALITVKEADELAQRIDGLVAEPNVDPLVQRRELRQTLDGGQAGSVVQLVNVYRVDEVFRRVVLRDDLVDLAVALLGPSVRIFRDQVFYKPPEIGGEVFLHQDNRYWHLEPPLGITVWIALDDVTEVNGCVYFLKGTHRLGRVEHVRALDGQSILLEAVMEKNSGVPMPLLKGWASVHHCEVLHWSPENRTRVPRRGYTIQYIADHVRHRGKATDLFPLVRGG